MRCSSDLAFLTIFRLDIPADLPIIDADRQRIEKTIKNLIYELSAEAILSQGGQGLLRVEIGAADLTIIMLAKVKVPSYIGNTPVNPALSYNHFVIQQHGGSLQIEQNEGIVQIEFSLPIAQGQLSS